MENTKHYHQHQKALSKSGNQHQGIAPSEPARRMEEHGHHHKRSNQHEPHQNIPTQVTQRRIMLHPRPIGMLEKPPPHIIHILGIFVKGLVRNNINPLHARRKQQLGLPSFLRQGTDGEQLTPALTHSSTTAIEHGVHGTAHEIPSLTFLFHGRNARRAKRLIVRGIVVIVPVIRIMGQSRIDGVASKQGVRAGSVVLVLALVKVLHDGVVGGGQTSGGARAIGLG
mmetsp:Transcript_38080/g.68625  ORF Transcript_38080/g.68625 Transcript_38080/m.68625 type:complete len:226 (+) Transcript_38080:1240-1917(+)